MKRPLYIREFLNHPKYHAGAHIIMELDRYGNGRVVIADCRKTINLCIDTWGSGDRKNAIHKLDVLHRAIGRALRHVRSSDIR